MSGHQYSFLHPSDVADNSPSTLLKTSEWPVLRTPRGDWPANPPKRPCPHSSPETESMEPDQTADEWAWHEGLATGIPSEESDKTSEQHFSEDALTDKDKPGGVISAEKILITELLARYEEQGRHGRPVTDSMDNLTVYFGLSLIQILDVDESNQVLKSNVWYHYEWTDILLQWNPADHNNIEDVRVPSQKIWLPDIQLYNL
ncbi:hypothetical protein ACOMHN_062327 [Nucella lapillus]